MDPKNIFRPDPRFRKQAGPAATPLAPQPITITVNFDNGGKEMRFSTDRNTNAIEMGSIAMTLMQGQFQIMAQSIINHPAPVDRNAPHAYDVNQDSEKSVRGLACGKCGLVQDDLIHLGTNADEPPNPQGSEGKVS